MERLAGSEEYLNAILQQLFQGHDVAAEVQGGHVVFPDHPGLWANGILFAFNDNIVQLDLNFGGFDGPRILGEAIAGFGPDRNAQANFAVQAIANASFHVFLPAFFGRPPCHGTERETWIIGGTPRDVYSGLITTIFGYPPAQANGTPDLSFYPAFIDRLKTYPLPPGTHWMRIYQMRHNGAVQCNEVLLDNEPWDEMQNLMAELPWPVSEETYDVRVFLIVKDPT